MDLLLCVVHKSYLTHGSMWECISTGCFNVNKYNPLAILGRSNYSCLLLKWFSRDYYRSCTSRVLRLGPYTRWRSVPLSVGRPNARSPFDFRSCIIQSTRDWIPQNCFTVNTFSMPRAMENWNSTINVEKAAVFTSKARLRACMSLCRFRKFAIVCVIARNVAVVSAFLAGMVLCQSSRIISCKKNYLTIAQILHNLLYPQMRFHYIAKFRSMWPLH